MTDDNGPGEPSDVTNQIVTNGTSLTSPSLTGDDVLGRLIAWWGEDGAIHLASDQESPPYSGETLPVPWTTSDSPAVCLVTAWARVYLTWTDADGVHIASTGGGDGWKHSFVATGASSGPAMAFDGADRLFIAWRDDSSVLALAVCDESDNLTYFESGQTIYSRPSLAWADGQGLYALSGGDVDGYGDLAMRCFNSADGGESFSEVPLSAYDSIGPPSLVVADGWYYLAWADGQSSQLTFAATEALGSFVGTQLSEGCHGGAPTLISCGDSLAVAWTSGTAPEDPRAHHVTVGTLPTSGQGVPSSDDVRERYARLLQPRAPDPCSDPTTIWDPSDETCVSRFGCVGNCVTRSYVGVANMPVFNPILFAICLTKNC